MSQLRGRIASLLLRSRARRTCLPRRPPPAFLVKGAQGAVRLGIIGFPGCSLDSSLISQALQERLLVLFDSISMASTTTAPCETGVAAPCEAGVALSLEQMTNGDAYSTFVAKSPKVIFVLGGPGSGKGTQCATIVEKYGFTHLSAGDLLRAEINSGSENGTMIQNMIKEGKIVPSEVTVKLLQKAMQESGNDKFLIDGFPRNEENRAAFELVTGIQPKFILFFDCSEEEMEKRLLGRNQGRVDDNIETIRKRFKVFVDSSLPVINYYESLGKVRKIDAARTRDEVFKSIEPLFLPFIDITPAMELNDE